MAADNVMVSGDDLTDYGDAQSTSRNTTQMSDRSAGTSNSPAQLFMQVQKLDHDSPGSSLGNEDYCPCEGGFAIR